MVSQKHVDHQIKRLGLSFPFFGRPELRELPNILFPGENILSCLLGFYSGGIAMLVATDQRLLLIDKKMWFLSLEDLRYDMITEVDYCHKLLQAETKIHTMNKSLEFRTWNAPRLRKLTVLVQEKLMEMRQMQSTQQQMPPQPQPTYAMQPGQYQYPQQSQGMVPQSFTQPFGQTYLSRAMMRPRIGKFTLKTMTIAR